MRCAIVFGKVIDAVECTNCYRAGADKVLIWEVPMPCALAILFARRINYPVLLVQHEFPNNQSFNNMKDIFVGGQINKGVVKGKRKTNAVMLVDTFKILTVINLKIASMQKIEFRGK